MPQGVEFVYGEFFGTSGTFRHFVQASEIVSQRLALLPETQRHEAEKCFGIRRGRFRRQPNHRGVDFRRRLKCSGRDGEEELGVCQILAFHREIAVVARARLRGDAFGDFLLNQKNGMREWRGVAQVTRDQRGRDVVRQIAGQHARAPLRPVGVEGVGFEKSQPREARAQVFGENSIEFNGGDAAGVFQQFFGERTAAGTDLDGQRDMIAAGGAGNAFENPGADEKMLPELLPDEISL